MCLPVPVQGFQQLINNFAMTGCFIAFQSLVVFSNTALIGINLRSMIDLHKLISAWSSTHQVEDAAVGRAARSCRMIMSAGRWPTNQQ
jgi:hypothetical protein